ncbi:hypothetical protein MTR67_025765 [Solanum verrucosum]|uniref:Uncharacterized protein n=1 Tax=Solanum verrucosum TaxID=315347 RepID=A0AAF0TYY2_SOLVR|nr:hypothetical protein MTR67_025765 [Solanum verrucosum]
MDEGMGLHSYIAQVDLERKHVIHELNRAKTQVPQISILHVIDPAEHSRDVARPVPTSISVCRGFIDSQSVSAELRKPGQGFA